MMPLGSLLVGSVSQYVGAPNTILVEGVIALGVVGIFWSYLKTPAVGEKEVAVMEGTASGAAPLEGGVAAVEEIEEKTAVAVGEAGEITEPV